MKSKGRFKVLTFAIAFLLLGAALVVGAVQTNSHARAAGPVITGLHVVGNQLVNGSNVPIVPHGVNHMGGE
jgi:hypothetical protein